MSGAKQAYAERSWVARDGVEIFFRDYAGAGGPARLPVVCLHGLTRNSKDFAEIAAAMAGAGRRVLVPDMRGRGRSGRDPDPMRYVPRTYARDVIGLLEATGTARALFVGTSMGGIITMMVASMRGSLVAGAVLNDIGPEAAPEGLARIAGYAGTPAEVASWPDAAAYVRRLNEAAFPGVDAAYWDDFARRTFAEQADGKPVLDYDPDIRKPILAGKLKAPRFLAWWLFRRLAQRSLFGRRRPLLLLRGATSDILSAEIANRMQKAAPHMTRVEIPGVGHAPMLSEAAAEAAILSFLERAP